MKKLKQSQVDRYLSNFSSLKELPAPRQGWIKYIRNALGMTAEQLAKRVGVSRRRLVMIEQAEIQDSTTLKTLKRLAESMNCKVVYAIVPETSIGQIIEQQARKFAMKHVNEVAHHMALEAQSVENQKAVEAQIEDLVQNYLSKSSKIIWDD